MDQGFDIFELNLQKFEPRFVWNFFSKGAQINFIMSRSKIVISIMINQGTLLKWPSELRYSDRIQGVSGSNPIRRSAVLRDPTSLWEHQWPSGHNLTSTVINMSEWGCTLMMAQCWLWDIQIVDTITVMGCLRS